MPPVEFEATIPASDRPQTYAIDLPLLYFLKLLARSFWRVANLHLLVLLRLFVSLCLSSATCN